MDKQERKVCEETRLFDARRSFQLYLRRRKDGPWHILEVYETPGGPWSPSPYVRARARRLRDGRIRRFWARTVMTQTWRLGDA